MAIKDLLAKYGPKIASKAPGLAGVLGGVAKSNVVMGGAAIGASSALVNQGFGIAKEGIKQLVGAWQWIFMLIFASIIAYLNIFLISGFIPKLVLYLVFFISYAFTFKKSIDLKKITPWVFIISLCGIFAPTIGNFFIEFIPLEIVKEFLILILIWVGYLGPVFMLFIVEHEDNKITNLLSILFIISIIIFLFMSLGDLVALDYYDGITGTISDQQQQMIQDVLTKLLTGVKMIPGKTAEIFKKGTNTTKDFVNQSMTYAVTGKSFEETVDEQAGVSSLGVTFNKVELTSADGEYLRGTPVSAWGTIEGKSMNRQIDVKVDCIADPTKEAIQGKLSQSEFTFYDYTFEDFICSFPKDAFEEKTYELKMIASYDYSTSAYLRRYFIQRNTLDGMRQKGIDPIEFYSISQDDEASRNTNSPIDLRIVKSGLLIPLEHSDEFIVGIRIDNDIKNRETGYIKNIQNMVFSLPSGFRLKEESGEFSCTEKFTPMDPTSCSISCNNDQSCLKDCNEYDSYILDVDSFNENHIQRLNDNAVANGDKGINVPIMISCTLIADDFNTLFSSGNFAIKNFRTRIDYTYATSMSKSFTIKENSNYVPESAVTICSGKTSYWDKDISSISAIKANADEVISVLNDHLSYTDDCDYIAKAIAAFLWRGSDAQYQDYVDGDLIFKIPSSVKDDYSSISNADISSIDGEAAFIDQYLKVSMEEDCKLNQDQGNIDCAIEKYIGNKAAVPIIIQLAKSYKGG